MSTRLLPLSILALSFSGIGQAQQKVTPKAPPKSANARLADDTRIQKEPLTIRGHVVHAKGGVGIPGVTVSATSAARTVTDSSGGFILQGLDRSRPQYSLKLTEANCEISPDSKTVSTPLSGPLDTVFSVGKHICPTPGK